MTGGQAIGARPSDDIRVSTATVESRRGRPLGAPTVPVNPDNVAAAEDVIDRITLRLHSPRSRRIS